MLITGFQLAAARALVGMDQTKLAELSGTHVNTIRLMEAAKAGRIGGRLSTIQAVQAALEAKGVEFLNSSAPGVRMKSRP